MAKVVTVSGKPIFVGSKIATNSECCIHCGYHTGGSGGNNGACCHADGSCTITTETECDGTYRGNGTDCAGPHGEDCNPPPIPPDCECTDPSSITMQKDFVQWFDPDPQPAWPDTWSASDAYSDDIETDDGGCVPFEHHRVRVRFVMPPAPVQCTLKWNILHVQLSDSFSRTFTNNIQETIIEVGTTIIGPIEIPSPGNSGCGTGLIENYNYPSGGTGGCCLEGTFCALNFTSTDCANRAGTFEGNCTNTCSGCGFSAPP